MRNPRADDRAEDPLGGDTPTVSAAVIAGGHDDYVLEAIQSLTAQTIAFDELVIFLNRRSPEVSNLIGSFLTSWKNTHPSNAKVRITILRSMEYLPTTEAARRIAEICLGDYLVLVDDDDRLDSTFLHFLKAAMEKSSMGTVFAPRHAWFTREPLKTTPRIPLAKRASASPWIWINRIAASAGAQFPTGGTALPVELLRETDALRSAIAIVQTDGLCSLRLARFGYRGLFVKECIYHVRQHDNYSPDKWRKYDYGMGVLRATATVEAGTRLQEYLSLVFGCLEKRGIRHLDEYHAGMQEVDSSLIPASEKSCVFANALRGVLAILRRTAFLLQSLTRQFR